MIFLTGDKEEFENNSKMCFGLRVEELCRGSPVFDEAVDCQTEEDDISDLQAEND